MLMQLFDTLYTSVLYAADYVERWDTKRWHTYHKKDAPKQLHSHICGVDRFVPLIIKERRSELNSYGAIFTWFSSRTVTNSLHVDSFILALPRFMARRGTGRTMEQILWVLGMN